MPLFKSERKAQNFGTSLALTLPSMFAKAHELEKGTRVRVLYGLDGVLVISCIEDDSEMKDSLLKIIQNLDSSEKEKELTEDENK